MTVRVAYNYLLFLLGLRPTVPATIINRIRVVECGEELVEVPSVPRLVLRPVAPGVSLKARAGAVTRLVCAVNGLPISYTLIVVDAYRSRAVQEGRWAVRLGEVALRMPGATSTQIENEARRFTAKPAGGGSGHQAGAAFDVTLGDVDGNALDLGTSIKEAGPLTATHAPNLTPAQAARREVLLTAMSHAGFVNYPLEWWHFCYGDRMWAAYLRNSHAIYGIDFLEGVG